VRENNLFTKLKSTVTIFITFEIWLESNIAIFQRLKDCVSHAKKKVGKRCPRANRITLEGSMKKEAMGGWKGRRARELACVCLLFPLRFRSVTFIRAFRSRRGALFYSGRREAGRSAKKDARRWTEKTWHASGIRDCPLKPARVDTKCYSAHGFHAPRHILCVWEK